MPDKTSKATARVGVCLLWLAIWQGAYLAVGQDLLLASPLAVLRRLGSLAGTAAFWQTLGGSLGRILLGFLLGLLWGTLIAALTSRSGVLYSFFSLPMDLIKAMPVASFVILALVWVSGRRLSIFIAFTIVLPLVWRNVHEGLAQVDGQLLEMARVFRLSRWQVFRSITVPSVLPYFLSAARVGLGFAWKAGIAGEVIAIPNAAIGTELYNAKVYLETGDLFAWTAVIILLSVLLERLMVLLVQLLANRSNRLARREEEA